MSASHDYSKMDTHLLKVIFSFMRYGDIYFCSLVCKNWQAATREYFLTLPRIHALKMTHDPWPSERMTSYMMCPSCLHIGLTTDDDRLKTLFNVFREAGLLNKILSVGRTQGSYIVVIIDHQSDKWIIEGSMGTASNEIQSKIFGGEHS
uniref:F-box domain-containing protein n=1 Tax=Trichuris muris TaxID=70415 RepID=A0A5S6QN43_TRIMR